jgi:outer membrane protein assembly factor BamA
VYRANDSVHVDARFGWLHDPTLQEPAGTFMPDFPSTLVRFAADPGVSGPQPNYLHNEFAVTADTRDHKGHPTSGAVYRAALTTYSDRGTGTFSFNQYEAEGLQLVPIVGKRWLLALHGWLVAADAGDNHDVPIYLQPSIGGNNTLRAYHTYRFHDRDALVVNAESRWAVYEHVDVAAFLDAGNVAPRFGDLNVSKRSYGGGVRLHTARSTLARLDVATGTEGWHVVVRTTEPFRLMRISQRMADLPFAP